MRKEMFDHEIKILRDTFGRLLRRHAHTNLSKLILKTHPADLSVVFRYFMDEEQIQVFSIMEENEHTAEFLVELDDTLLANLLENESPERIAHVIQQASANDQSYILGTLEDEQAQSVIELLKAEEQEEIEELMGYPEDSAGAMMTTDVFTLYQDTSCQDALKSLQHQTVESTQNQSNTNFLKQHFHFAADLNPACGHPANNNRGRLGSNISTHSNDDGDKSR